MIKAVIDTNCLVLSIPRHREEYWLYRAFRDKAFTWFIRNEIMTEYVEILTSFYSTKTADIVINTLLMANNVTLKEPDFKWFVIVQDPDDNKFADLAYNANVDYLVSNDKHFNVLKNLDFPPLQVIDLEEFRKILGY